jgi:hypothetical protein
MQLTINRNLLKYSASRAIFCRACRAIADARRWIIATQGDHVTQCCSACWDTLIAGKPVPASVEVLDGRVIFKRGK